MPTLELGEHFAVRPPVEDDSLVLVTDGEAEEHQSPKSCAISPQPSMLASVSIQIPKKNAPRESEDSAGREVQPKRQEETIEKQKAPLLERGYESSGRKPSANIVAVCVAVCQHLMLRFPPVFAVGAIRDLFSSATDLSGVLKRK